MEKILKEIIYPNKPRVEFIIKFASSQIKFLSK